MTEPRTEYSKSSVWAELDALGEEEVLLRHRVEKRWGVPPFERAELVDLWLKSKDDARALEASMRRDAREEETLLIARRANNIAISAMILATLATISAAIIGVMYASPK